MDYLSLEHNYEEVPARQIDRRCTDVFCTLFTSAFAITLFVFATLAFIRNINNPSPYLNINPQLLVDSLNSDITKSDFQGFTTTLFWAAILSLSIGLLWMTIAHNAPFFAPRIACFCAILSLLAVSVFSIFVQNKLFENISWLRWAVVGVSGFVAILIFLFLILYKKELSFQGLLLKSSVRFLNQRSGNFFDVLLWLFFTCGLTVLILFQQLSFSYGYSKNNNLFDLSNPNIWGILNIVQFVWGLQFLKDSFIFVLSGNAIDWYWREGSNQSTENGLGWTNWLCHNWGSVAYGSFLNAFFKIPCLLLELLICHPDSYCSPCGRCRDNNCLYFLACLVRTDSYAYNYCDSSRQALQLYQQVSFIKGKQSPQRNYRIISTIFLTTLGFILSYLILTKKVQTMNIWFLIVLVFVVYAIVEYFSSLHASPAEGIQLCVIVQLIKDGGYNFMQRCHTSIRKEIQDLQERTASSS